MASVMLAGPAPLAAPEAREFAGNPTAVVRAMSLPADLPKTIRACFDRFYAAPHPGIAAPGHNVVFYPDWAPGRANPIECGVLVEAPVAAQGDTVPSALPAGRVAVVTHLGPYDRMHPTYELLHAWVERNGWRRAGPFWEEYDDPAEDPARVRTDIYLLLKA